LRHLAEFLGYARVTEVRALTPPQLRDYCLHLASKRSPGGVHAAYRAIWVFLRWWEAETEPDHWVNPVRKVKPPKVPQIALEPVPLPDLRAMLSTCERRTFSRDRDRAILLCLLDTGGRASEFVAQELSDVNLSTGAIAVRHGKGGRTRATFLGIRARRDLIRYLRHRAHASPSDPLWITTSGRRLTYWGLREIVRRRANKAGTATPSLHIFRRAFELLSLRSGADLVSLQRLLGHADLSVLQQYLKQTQDDLRSAHERHGPVDHAL